ncbi:thioredoxin family protein [Diaphorobacter aerolatus]|uniref:Thioredoxin family protein n=1 Tax=Diaphorobacter aerolatus TaxID=1288495 RepID=A0A7H0GJT0_9BURK|nr:thioredoxin family protein [Diaphorobacter aerolatus]QNP48546.1 thioredoxin family protein [Diaphorobacter aerolatus]
MTVLRVSASPAAPADERPVQRVICLCAQWCVVCGQYRPQFEALAGQFPGVEFRWVDVEDEEEAMGDYDVETFPTLLIAEGDEPRFLGPVLPQPGLVGTLLKRLMHEGVHAADAHAAELLARIVRSHS